MAAIKETREHRKVEIEFEITGDDRMCWLKASRRIEFVADRMLVFLGSVDGEPWRCDAVRIIGHNPNEPREDDLEVFHRPNQNTGLFQDWTPVWMRDQVREMLETINAEEG